MSKSSTWRYYDVAVALFVASLLTANIIAVKLIEIGPIIVPAGVVIFPVSYILGDILTEVYGFRWARRAIWLGFLGNLVAVVAIWIAGLLPSPAFWQNQAAWDTILGFTPRLLVASFVAYLVGEFANSTVLAKMKVWTQGKYLWTRTISSTIVGQGLDSLVFILIAFGGLMAPAVIMTTVISQWLFKSVYEIVATPLTYYRRQQAQAGRRCRHLRHQHQHEPVLVRVAGRQPMTTPNTGFADVNGARLYYETAGAGRPVVFVHAGLADSGMWDGQFQAFATHHRTIRYDMRGFGQSVPVKGEYSHAEDLAGLLEFLGVTQASLVGCSQGGSVILDFALANPAAAAALVLVSASPVGLELDMPASPKFADLQAALLTNDWMAFLELSAQIWFDGAGRTPDQVNTDARKRLVGMYLRRLQLTRADPGKEQPVPDPPAADRLGELNLPTLIVTGDRDLEFVHAAAAYMAARIAGAQTVMLPDAAHMLNMEHPKEFNQIVLDFLAHVL